MLLLSQLQFATSFKDPAAQSTFLTGTRVIEYISYRDRGHRVHFLQVKGSQSTFLTGTGVIRYISYRYRRHKVHFLHVQGSLSTFLTGTGVIGYIFYRCRDHRVYFIQVKGFQSTFHIGTGVIKYIFYRYIGHRACFGAYIEYISFKCMVHRIHQSSIFIFIFLAHPQSSLAFHWPRIDMEQQLSIKLLDISGKFKLLDISGKIQLLNTSSKTKKLDVSLKLIFTKRKLNIVLKESCSK